ncbi:DUF6505 family protein [Aurantimonas sp. A2-1-M11]|uniref:DUF6505 family protein n=1 Tax=Aurantimonas sp. A2-1-M11 TaxID=3113712 RepID=UPI002F94F3F9
MALKLPRTIRMDPSDEFVFAEAAEPGEWAVSGTFRFWNRDVASLAGKERQAFRGGLLGVTSFGWSTLVVVSEASEAEREFVVETLAAQLVKHLGAPDVATARPAAEEEVAFAASLCDHPVNTMLAVQRSVENGDIRERFRTLHRREGAIDHSRAFGFVEIDDDDDAYAEHLDIRSLGRSQP